MRKRLTFLLICGVCAAAAAQITVNPPKKPAVLEGYPPEEEETLPGKPKRKVTVEEEGPPPVTVPRGCYYVRMDDLSRAAADTKNKDLKALLTKYVIAHDRLIFTDQTTRTICPVPLYREAKFPTQFGVFPLNEDWEPRRVETISVSRVQRIDQYEEQLAREAERLWNPPLTNRLPSDDAPPAEKALAAEQLLSAALLFLEGARDASKRRGTGWDRVRAETVAKLMDARLKRLRLAAELKDWNTVRTLGARMAGLYPGQQKLLEEVYATRLAEAILAAKSEQLIDLERASELLVEFESRYPGSKNPSVGQVKSALNQQKEKLFKRAELAVKTEDKEATRLLRTLEALDPNYPGLRELQSQVKGNYSIITVGVPRLPRLMSPVTARTDAERMAVELLFDSLIDALPDDVLGTRFQPGLSAGFPGIAVNGRDVRLLRPVDWAGLPQQYADAADVAGTIRLLKRDYSATWAAANAEWLAENPRVDDQNSLRIGFQGAHPYPLSLLNFKVMPTRWLAGKGYKADDAAFAMHPFGTGPYKAITGPDGKVSSFAANPTYGKRPDKLGQPFIKEIRFIDLSKKVNLPAEFKTEQLHILPDVPTADLAKYRGPSSGLTGRVDVVTASQNRRVYILAINHRRPILRSVPLRALLAYAIDRESILTQVYRSGYSEFHKAMSGPFPPESWPVPRLPASPKPLLDRDMASAKFSEHCKASGSTPLRLAFPADDKHAKIAAEMIRKQIEALGSSPDGKVTVTLDELPYDAFETRVYREGNFDLAYVPFDYPDDWYPFGLAALLDPAASTPGGRNLGGYLDKQANITREDQDLSAALIDLRRHADYTGKLMPLAQATHRKFLDAMPFVPLWQLDRHTVISSKLQISIGNESGPAASKLLPPAIFVQVGRWKLN